MHTQSLGGFWGNRFMLARPIVSASRGPCAEDAARQLWEYAPTESRRFATAVAWRATMAVQQRPASEQL